MFNNDQYNSTETAGRRNMNLKPYYTNLWILANPQILLRIIKGFLRAFIFKKNTLKTIELYPTFDCQSKCIMCSVEKYKRVKKEELEISDYKSIAQQGATMGAIAMTLLGGEPLLAENVECIIRIFKSQKYFVTIVSNAISITREKVIKLRNAGLDSIYFSLESLDSSINDNIRGYKGHFQKVIEAIRICKEAELLVGICGIIFPGQLERYKKILEFCNKNDLISSGGEVAVVGAAEKLELVTDDEHGQLITLLKKYPRLTFDWALSYFLKPRCPGGKEKLGITCYGDVIGCSLNPISFGNIKSEKIIKIWQRMGCFSQFKKDSERCLTAGDRYYIENYITPIAKLNKHPILFSQHPMINRQNEPYLFI
jgi:MoaA/NifB/PqqE/SkfB family radical SAM enzyme